MDLTNSNILIIILLIKIIVLWIVIYSKNRIIKNIEDFYEDYIRDYEKTLYQLKSEIDNYKSYKYKLSQQFKGKNQ